MVTTISLRWAKDSSRSPAAASPSSPTWPSPPRTSTKPGRKKRASAPQPAARQALRCGSRDRQRRARPLAGPVARQATPPRVDRRARFADVSCVEMKERWRLLSVGDRLAEVVAGIIITLSFTASLSVGTAGKAEVQTALYGALGCGVA